MGKIGRNEPCPCGSGKKYKRCHGSIEQTEVPWPQMDRAIAHAQAVHVQRERQQGLGRPIISTEFAGHRLVAVKNRLHFSKKWRTFHDFLFDYIRDVLGAEWGNSEIAKPLNERHPILVWYDHVCRQQQKYMEKPGEIYSAPYTGAVMAYMQLAYDLYLLEHNIELQERLITRLRNRSNFFGARYETFVAARLVQAGFSIEFEDETDQLTTHCEYTATFTKTGRKFSVEAKHRDAMSKRFRPGRLLVKALLKHAQFERIVFIDVNVPDEASGIDVPNYLERTLTKLKRFEGKEIDCHALPDAYLVITNTPGHHHLEKEGVRSIGLIDGFQKADFKRGWVEYPSLRAAIEARERHIEMHALLQSMNDHMEIPSTFDGEMSVFAFGQGDRKLTIGNRYSVASANGQQRVGVLTTATVLEPESRAYGALTFDDGASEIHYWELTQEELAAWRRHPDTFFGQVQQRQKKIETPLQLYDFFLDNYKITPKERLLEILATSTDIEDLKKLDQPQLASVYAERCAMAAWAMTGQSEKLGDNKK